MKSLTKRCQFAIISLVLIACSKKEKILIPEVIQLENPDQIVPLTDSLVKPIHYHNIPSLEELPVNESKEKFIALVLPAVLIAKYELDKIREHITELSEKEKWSMDDSLFYQMELQRFKGNNINDLLVRMHTHPNSIVLAQAAIESGWGSSRFFKEANNLFGIWAYNKDEPRIAANNSDVFLRKYENISHSIEDYFETIGKARAYGDFRKVRSKSDNVYDLLPHLKYYSERGKVYTNQLKTIINQNNLTRFDNYIIDPEYFVDK